jgi:hypothetical protein
MSKETTKGMLQMEADNNYLRVRVIADDFTKPLVKWHNVLAVLTELGIHVNLQDWPKGSAFNPENAEALFPVVGVTISASLRSEDNFGMIWVEYLRPRDQNPISRGQWCGIPPEWTEKWMQIYNNYAHEPFALKGLSEDLDPN